MSEVQAKVICGANASRCICPKEPGHVEAGDPVHVCGVKKHSVWGTAAPGCGGSWKGTWAPDAEPPEFEIVTFPGGIPADEEGVALTFFLTLLDRMDPRPR